MTIFNRACRLLWVGVLLGAAPLSAQTLKIATVAPEGSAWMKEMRQAAADAKQATAGRVQIKYYPGGVMGNDATVLKKIRLGQLQGGALTASELSNLSKTAQLYGLPFLFSAVDEIDAARQQFDPRLAADLDTAGFTVLSLSGVGFAYLMSSAEVDSRKALESRKVWVPQNDLIAERTFRAGGISPIPLPLPDVFTALQTGLVDTVGNTPAGAIALQWHSRLRQVLDLPLSYIVGYVVVDKRAWGKLAEADRALVLDAFKQASQRIDAGNRRADSEAMQALESMGIQKVAPSAEEIQRWQQVGRSVIDRLTEEGVLDGEAVTAIRALLADRRQAAGAAPAAP